MSLCRGLPVVCPCAGVLPVSCSYVVVSLFCVLMGLFHVRVWGSVCYVFMCRGLLVVCQCAGVLPVVCQCAGVLPVVCQCAGGLPVVCQCVGVCLFPVHV